MNELYAALMSWAITLSGYSAPDQMPEVQSVSHATLVQKACNGRECKVLGWFPPGQTIFVDDRLNAEQSLYASSIVVHEMVHYLQQQSGKYEKPYTCETLITMEREAYAAQREFFIRYGVYQPVGASMHHVGCETVNQHVNEKTPLAANDATATVHNH
jgi:hypothetical protein